LSSNYQDDTEKKRDVVSALEHHNHHVIASNHQVKPEKNGDDMIVNGAYVETKNFGSLLKKRWKCAIPLLRGAEGCVYARAMKRGKTHPCQRTSHPAPSREGNRKYS